jgi:hypothetical protein
MDQFTFMVDTLLSEHYREMLTDEEFENSSFAFVQSTLLNGYNITDIAEYQTRTKPITVRVN